ncbi:MAG TPA: glycoside hydrolase family 2 TIM barrel-domain containing protein [Candidatus Bathyarchaeia archaeon]|nr:glycoside hydrolase family 2 TIM barrel-domain containing protein [Candidatus Bathyarchaeia archaeon]
MTGARFLLQKLETLILIFVPLLSLQANAVRETLSLNGSWQFVKVESLDSAPPGSGWSTIEVPGTVQGHNYERAWFRRSFNAPESWNGKRILLRFGGVKFDSRVFINDARTGGCFNGYDAFDLDITDHVRFGAENDLLVGVQDWTALFAGDKLALPAKADWTALRRIPRDRVLAPIGGRFDLYGIWDDVDLEAAPPVHVAGCFVRPSVGRQRLSIDAAVANKSAAEFSGRIEARIYPFSDPGGAALPTSSAAPVKIPAAQVKTIRLEIENPGLKFWWPHEPNLYILEIRVGDDVHRERFGWREFRAENGDFFLNGVQVHLLGRSWWPYDVPNTDEAITAKIKMLKENHVNFFRTHTQPWPRRWYELADELGLMMMPEAAIFTDDETYRIDDPAFWNHYSEHLSSMVRNLRNHPSIVMWSLENEFCGVRAKRNPTAETNLARMGGIVKDLDDTRPIVFESDGDPAGAADVIGLHYPNEFPERRLWPNDAFWMDSPNGSRRDKMFWPTPEFLWDRSKPLYIGEFLWVPDEAPTTASLFFGDLAYTDPRPYHFKAIAEAWRMQILAYRHYGVSGFAPWGYDYIKPDGERRPVLLAQTDMFCPLAAFIREHDNRFFAGETVARTVELFNDTTSAAAARLVWELLKNNEPVASGELAVDLPAGAHKEQILDLPMPSVAGRTALSLRLTLLMQGDARFRQDWPVDVFPKHTWNLPDVSLFLYDPQDSLASDFQQANVRFTPLDTLDQWPGDGILVIGAQSSPIQPGAQTPVIATPGKQFQTLSQKVAKGGRVLVLAQTPDTAGCLPVRLTSLSSTMAFAQQPSHPVLAGFMPEDFRWWRGDHLVTRCEPARPPRGGAQALIVTGSDQGIAHAPLLELPDGNGFWLVCQLLVAEKLDSEPVASQLLEQMLTYLGAYKAPTTGTAFVGTPALNDRLNELGLNFERLADWSSLSASTTRLLVLQADGATVAEHAAQLFSFLEQGGNVVLHRPSAADFQQIRTSLNVPLEFLASRGPVSRAEGEHPFIETLVREDLHWIEERPAFSRAAPPRAGDMAEALFVSAAKDSSAKSCLALTSPPALVSVPVGKGWLVVNAIRWDEPGANALRAGRFACSLLAALGGRFCVPAPVTVLEAEAMQPNPGIGAFTRAQDHVLMGANGYVEQAVKIAEPGSYRLGLHAKGTPVDGVFSIMAVQLDGNELGRVECASPSWSVFELLADLPAGDHVFRFAFINDARRPNEDRNLWLDRVEIAPGP